MGKQLGVMGLGMFGFVLAEHLAAKYPRATILAYDQSQGIVHSLQKTRHHPIHFQTRVLANNVHVCASLRDFLPRCHIVVLAIPVQVVREAARQAFDHLSKSIFSFSDIQLYYSLMPYSVNNSIVLGVYHRIL